MPQIEVSIDTSTLEPEAGARLRQALDDEITATLRGHGLAVVSRSEQRRIEARIEMVNVELREYAISLDVVLAGEREVVAEGQACTACSEAQVIAKTVALLPAAQRFELRSDPDPAPEPPPPPQMQRLGGVGIAGIAMLAGGAASVIGGVTVAGNAWKHAEDGHAGQVKGAALVSVGVAAVLLGVAALAIDLTALDRQRRQRRLDVRVDASPTSAGVTMRGRF